LVGAEFRFLIGMCSGGSESEFGCVERLLDRPATRSVIERGGEGEAGVFVEWEDALDETLAEAIDTEDGGAVVVLHRARDDFRRAGALLVDENGELEGIGLGVGRDDFHLFRNIAAAYGHDLLSGFEEERGCRYGRCEQATGIIA